MFKRSKICSGVLLALGGTLLVPAAPSFAQTGAAERVEITGSRIKRIDSETSQPIFTLTRQDIEAQGLTSVGDVIQNLSSNGSALNSTFNNGGNGETRVSLRNLGSNRTLVLVNGKRWVGGTGLGGAVDLNSIPATAIDRIDVLKDGASVTYGSDAIAGVVNIVLRSAFDGAEINTFYGQYDKGDGLKKSIDFTIGASGKRARAMIAAGYVKEEPVSAGARDISAVPIFGVSPGVSGSSTTPFGRFAVCNGTWNATAGTCSGTQTQPGGAAGQFTYNPGATGTAFRPYNTATDAYNFAPDNYLVTPQERISLYGGGSFDITDDIQFYVRGVFNNRKSSQLLAAMPIVLGTGPGAGVIARTLSISANSIYNPFGLDVVRIQRRATETGGRQFNQDVTTSVLQVGVNGSTTIADRFVSWEVGATYGRNRQSDITTGLFNVPALRDAIGPSMLVNGNPICVRTPGNAATQIANCVPINLLGAAGSITPAMLGYSTFTAQDNLGYEMKHYFANVSADLFKLPAGTLGFAAGFEKRDESGFDSPDALIASGNTTGNARTPTSGAYDVSEVYAELGIPLLKDLPLVKKLDLSLAVRKSDYSNFGDTTNTKAGLRWQVVPSFLVRANWSEGFRAPSVAELFQGAADSFQSIADPCASPPLGGYATLTAEQRARCTAQGVPTGGYDQGNTQIRITVGGNPNLKPETSVTTTVGFVFAPEMLPGFDVSVDWWKIELENGISSVSGQGILNRCIREGQAGACGLFTRGAGGTINSLLSADLNFTSNTLEGFDVTANYKFPKTSFGNFAVSADLVYMKKYLDSDGVNLIGQYFDRDNYWRTRLNTQIRWDMGNFGATLASRYYSKQIEECFNPGAFGVPNLCSDPANETNEFKAKLYNDLSVFYKTPWKGRVTVGVNNVFDVKPPVSYSTFANSFDPQYEIPGRFVYLRYSQSF